MSEQQRTPRRVLIRDTISFAGGWGLMIYQGVFAPQFEMLVFFGGMIVSGIPGALQAVALLLGRTPAPLPPSAPEPSQVES